MADRRKRCLVCRARPVAPLTGLGNNCSACVRSYRRWLRSHDGTIGAAIDWATTRRKRPTRRSPP
jgi:hypothetical protein